MTRGSERRSRRMRKRVNAEQAAETKPQEHPGLAKLKFATCSCGLTQGLSMLQSNDGKCVRCGAGVDMNSGEGAMDVGSDPRGLTPKNDKPKPAAEEKPDDGKQPTGEEEILTTLSAMLVEMGVDATLPEIARMGGE